jgi:hypothetical protein
MLQIRPDQLQMFLDHARGGFVARVVQFLRKQRSEHVNDETPSMVQRQMAAAEGYGIRTEASVVKFIELCAVFGEDFHDSGRFPLAERILTQQADGTVKVEELCEAAERNFAEAS